MKRFGHILFLIVSIFPMLVGMCFLTPNSAPVTLNGGGGANSLISAEDNKKEEKGEAWESPEIRSHEQFYTDLDISADMITEEDFSGSGTESDPWVIRNTRGFLHIYSESSSGITNFEGKYLKFAGDVYLNDETFDDDGNVYGGDGVVYQWSRQYRFLGLNIDGNGHCIYGLYQSFEEAKGEATGLTYSKINECKNLNMANIYIYAPNADRCGAFTNSVTRMVNCKILSGYICGKSYVGGFCSGATEMIDCDNYIHIASTSNGVSGFARNILYAKNCNFYGKYTPLIALTATITRFAGISYNPQANAIIEDCNNYSEFNGTKGAQNGGIVTWQQGDITLRNCKNYGDFTTGGQSGGLIGFVGKKCNIIIDNCANFGRINNTTLASAEFIGDNERIEDGLIQITNSYSRSSNGFGFVYAKTKNLIIDNCKIEFVDSGYGNTNNAIAFDLYSGARVSNVEVVVKKTFKAKEVEILNISKDSENVSVKNLHYIVEDEDSICEINCNNAKLSSCLIDGVLIERKSAKYYVGSDFSAYKTNWQTGKINLQTRVSNIFYQSKVTEDILFEKGFQKTDLSSKAVI